MICWWYVDDMLMTIWDDSDLMWWYDRDSDSDWYYSACSPRDIETKWLRHVETWTLQLYFLNCWRKLPCHPNLKSCTGSCRIQRFFLSFWCFQLRLKTAGRGELCLSEISTRCQLQRCFSQVVHPNRDPVGKAIIKTEDPAGRLQLGGILCLVYIILKHNYHMVWQSSFAFMVFAAVLTWLGNGQAQLERSATLKAKNRKPVAQRGADLSSRPVASNLRIKALVYCQGPCGWVGHWSSDSKRSPRKITLLKYIFHRQVGKSPH